jgi:hypothetical protein
VERKNGTRDTPRTLLSAADSPRDTGLGKAVEAVSPSSVRIRCWFHRLSNIRAKLPDEAAPEVMAHLYAVRDAPMLDAARAAADRFENAFAREFPSAIVCFKDGREALLAIHRVPVRHRIRVRTTSLAERSFEEERRRTKVIPRLTTERATLKLAFATTIRSADRWRRVSINDFERHQLRLLRAGLGLDPPPAEDQATRRRDRCTALALCPPPPPRGNASRRSWSEKLKARRTSGRTHLGTAPATFQKAIFGRSRTVACHSLQVVLLSPRTW